MAIYANQKDIYSCKPEKIQSPYIAVSENDYFLACRNLKASTVIVWLYMIKNHSDFKLEFSPKALQNKSGLSLNTIRQSVKELEEKKYLINVTSNIYLCFLQPVENIDDAINYYQNLVVPLPKNSSNSTKNCESALPKIGGETSNISSISMSTSNSDTEVSPNIDSDSDSEVVGDNDIIYRGLDDLSKEELIELQKDYGNHVQYNILHDKYKIDRKYLNNNLGKETAYRLNRLSTEEIANRNINDTTYDDDYDLGDLPDFMNTFDEFDIQLYNKQKKIREEQEKESKKKIA